MKERWNRLLGRWKEKIPLPALLVLAVGCVLLLLPGGGEIMQETGRAEERDSFDLSAFERELEQALSEVAGAGKTSVVLSVSGGSRQILAQDKKQDGESLSAQTVTVGSGSAQAVVPIQTAAPVFRGALVVCPGASDAAVRLELTRAVAVLTGLGTDCICVCTGTS